MSDTSNAVRRQPSRTGAAAITRYYNAMDVMVYPRVSRRLMELGTPLKPLEAFATGKPVVASNGDGHRELIRGGCNGHLFSARSEEALARCLTEWPQAPRPGMKS